MRYLDAKTEALDETPALAFPLRTREWLIEGPFWAVTLVSQPTLVNALEQTGKRTGCTPAVDNPVDNLWRTGPVLWITAPTATMAG
ncbi:MAG: hypothetical protein JWR85_765 [Marmoricola sp.]|nr:hypothetical protein [Marmoricola sp.]